MKVHFWLRFNYQSFHRTGQAAEAISYGTPVLIGLMDDNLTPFYGVLYQLNEDVGQIIIGSYLFDVKLSYLKERFLGQKREILILSSLCR